MVGDHLDGIAGLENVGVGLVVDLAEVLVVEVALEAEVVEG